MDGPLVVGGLERVGFAPVPGQEQRRGSRTWLENQSILCLLRGPCPFFGVVRAFKGDACAATNAAGRPETRSQ